MSREDDPAQLRVPLDRLRARARQIFPLTAEVALGEVEVADAVLADDGLVKVDLELESVSGGVSVRGTVAGRWMAECRRCLDPVEGTVSVEIDEVARSEPGDSDAYPLGVDELDLAPMVGDAVLLELPMVPVCDGDCRGPEPERYEVSLPTDPVEPAKDPRWAALDGLEFN